MIILVVTTMALAFMSDFLKGNEVKKAGRIVHAMFSKARQFAGQKRRAHFIVFDTVNGTMTLYEDTDSSKTYTGADLKAAENPERLPWQVKFSKVPGAAVGVRPDGSLIWPSPGISDVPSTTFEMKISAMTAPDGDIILQLGDLQDKVYIDLDPYTGIVRKIEFLKM